MNNTSSGYQNQNGRGAATLDAASSTVGLQQKEVEQPGLKPETIPPVHEDQGSAQASSKKGSKKRLLAAVLGLGAILASGAGYRWWQYAATHQDTDNATVAGHIYQVSSRVAGTVLTVPVDDNQEVHPGQLLVQLDPHDYQVKVQQAQAALAVAQKQAETAQTTISLASETAQAQTTEAQGNVGDAIAAIAAAQAAVTEAQAGVPAAQAELSQTQANLAKAQADYNRYQALFQQGAVAQQQLDAARAAYETALGQQNAAQQAVNQARAKLAQAQEGVTRAQAQLSATRGGLQKAQASGVQTDVNRKQYAAAEAAIAQAEANLAEAQLQLSYTNITAPAEGRIGRKTVEAGNRVQAGQALMAVVGDQKWIVANFKETQVEHMRPGAEVEIKLDAFPHKTFSGRVDSFSPASGSEFALLPPDNATGNFTKVVQRIPIKIVFDPESIRGYESQITPGMSAEISVVVPKD